MKRFNILNAILLATNIFCVKSEVTFKLINVNGQNPSVVIASGQEVGLQLDEYPVYKATVDVNAPVEYHYAVNINGQRVEEQFSRTYTETSDKSTLNEFFDRTINVKEHPKLPRAYVPFERSNPSKLYDDTHVATIAIKVDPTALNNLYANPATQEKIRGVEVVYASPFSVRSFNNATFGISGQYTTTASKLSYKLSNLKNDKNKELYKRTAIKLRAEHMDPSYLRDKLYGDILNSLGVPAAQNKFARVFINEQPVGLFDLSDDIGNKRYLRETLNNGNKYEKENPIFKADYFPEGGCFGDLGYYGEESPMYGIYYYKGEDDEVEGVNNVMFKQHLLPLLRDISNYPTTGQLNLEKEMFLKFMAIEYAAGAIDNYWYKPGNYFIFKDATANNWYFLDSDFHFTFGVGGETKTLLDSTMQTYASTNAELQTAARPLLDNLLSNPQNQAFFQDVFKRLLETSFNIEALRPRIDSLADLIREDVQWDVNIPRVSQMAGAENMGYTYEHFVNQVESETADPMIVNEFPLKYWIMTKGQMIANEIGIPYPTVVDTQLGVVENPSQNLEASGVGKNISISKGLSLIFIICTILLAY